MLDRTGGYEVYAVLAKRMPRMARGARRAVRLATSFILRAVADRARAGGSAGRPQLAADFVDNLIEMVAASPRRDGRGRPLT